MSATKTRMPRADAAIIAARFIEQVGDCCERITVAGSLRRGLPTVGDIEVVAVPKVEPLTVIDMFGEPVTTEMVDLLDARLTMLVDRETVQKRPRSDGKTVWGSKMKYLIFEGAPIDLFTPDAKRFGLILFIRTGPAAYSHQHVTEKGKPLVVGHELNGRPITRYGTLPAIYRVREGWLPYRTSGQRIETPEEADVYRVLELPFREPWERR